MQLKINLTYWDCRRTREGECHALDITQTKVDNSLKILKDPNLFAHNHPSNQDECDTEKSIGQLEKKAQNIQNYLLLQFFATSSKIHEPALWIFQYYYIL